LNWLVLVAVAILTDSIRIFIDNYASDVYFKGNGAVSQKLFYAYTSIFFAIILALIGGLDFTSTPALTFLLLILSGIISSIASIPYYKALEIDNSTNLGIFIQLAPALYLILGWLFLGETVSWPQLLAIPIILAAPTLIVLTSRKNSRKTRARAILFSFLYVLGAVIGNLISVEQSAGAENLNLLTEIGLVLFGKGLGAFLIFLIVPKWRHRFRQVVKTSNFRVFRPLTANAIIGLIKDISYRTALAIAPSVALVSATADSTEPIIIFFMGLVLTLIWPKFGRETLNSKTVFVHVIATVLVVISIILLQV